MAQIKMCKSPLINLNKTDSQNQHSKIDNRWGFLGLHLHSCWTNMHRKNVLEVSMNPNLFFNNTAIPVQLPNIAGQRFNHA